MGKSETQLPQESSYEGLYQAIGLTKIEFNEAKQALASKDISILSRFNQTAQQRLRMREIITPDSPLLPNREDLHTQIITAARTGIEPRDYPELLFLAGPPGVGKSHWKKNMMDASIYVQTDPDAIRQQLLEHYDATNPSHIAVTQTEALNIAQQILDQSLEAHQSILCETTLRDFEWVQNTAQIARTQGYYPRIMFLHRPFNECFEGALSRIERPITLGLLLSSVHGYDNLARIYQEDVVDKIDILVFDQNKPHTGKISELIQYVDPFRPLLPDIKN